MHVLSVEPPSAAGFLPASWRLGLVAALVAVAAMLASGVVTASHSGRVAPQQLQIDLDSLRFKPSHLTARAGDIHVVLTNKDAVSHTFTIRSLGIDELIGSGERRRVDFRGGPGQLQIVCSLPGHLQAGMRATLRVK